MKVWDIVPPQRPKFYYAFLASICRHLSFHKVDWRMAAKRNAEIICLSSFDKERLWLFILRIWRLQGCIRM